MSVTLLDGGMGQELLARSGATPTPLWATQVMLDLPDLVRAIHDDYFRAGAEIATANTYGLHRDRLAPHGMEDRFKTLHIAACRAAVEARDAFGTGRVAGALGPLGWSYTTGDEPPLDEAAARFDEVCRVQAPFVDFYLIETAASLAQVRAALTGALGHGKPVWLGITVDDGDGTTLRSGEAVAEVAGILSDLKPDALLINCATPEAVDQGLPVIAEMGLPFGAYANGFTGIAQSFVKAGTTVKELTARTDLTPTAYAAFVDNWVAQGASIVGGCCEVGPAHIAEIARRLNPVAA